MGVTSFFLVSVLLCCSAANAEAGSKLALHVDISRPGRLIPSTLFGIFFEEINHAGTGGLWAELVSNRGFEAGGLNTPSSIDPWYPIGNESQVRLSTERSSCFVRNPVALKMEVLCEECPHGGAGVANPGFWGMNIIAGAQYLVTFWLQSTNSVSLSVSFVSGDGLWKLAEANIFIDESNSQEWSKQTLVVEANLTDHYGRLVLTSSKKGVIWLDQISVMPVDTYKGHGFRKELALMLEDLNPRFIRFPGGCYVEGVRLANAWRWRDSVGPWEERPGHFGDVWSYWSDDGLGFYELLQLAEDLRATPVWVFNNGISHTDEVSPSLIGPFVQDILDGIEFAKGPTNTKWGALRASMGHPDPFKLNHIAIGNEDCGKQYYRDNYMKFYKAIKLSYPDIKLISNCDGSSKQLDHPADLYDFHIYTSASTLFSMAHQFDYISRDGPKAFVSEYAVTGGDAGQGSLLAALAEGAFLIGLELNSDIVEMASYAPLFVNNNDRRWNPDSIVFDSWQQYGTPSYWVQHFFKHSGGAKILSFSIEAFNGTAPMVVMSAVRASENLIVKAVNFGKHDVLLEIVIRSLSHVIDTSTSTITVLSSSNVMDENSFASPNKVVPQIKSLNVFKQDIPSIVPNIEVNLPSHSFVAVTLKLNLFSMTE